LEQGIIAAIVLSLLDLVRRQYQPRRYVVAGDAKERVYLPVAAGTQTRPGLIVFRYDADLFYANSNRFVDDAEALVAGAPDPVQLFVLDCSGLSDIDFSASRSLLQLIDYLHARGARFGIAGADESILAALAVSGVRDRVSPDYLFSTVADALAQPLPRDQR
jgi:MFS superfamily sulfate permease-like transporter